MSEMSVGVGSEFRYQMLPMPAEVERGTAASLWMSLSDKSEE